MPGILLAKLQAAPQLCCCRRSFPAACLPECQSRRQPRSHGWCNSRRVNWVAGPSREPCAQQHDPGRCRRVSKVISGGFLSEQFLEKPASSPGGWLPACHVIPAAFVCWQLATVADRSCCSSSGGFRSTAVGSGGPLPRRIYSTLYPPG